MTELPDRPDDATLMAHARGRLAGEEAAAVERASRELPEVREDLELMRGLARARDAERDAGPGELGWARLSRAIDAAEAQARPRWRWGPPARIAATALLAVGLWQFAVVPWLPGRTGEDGYAPVTEALAGTVTVAFVPEATEAGIRALLLEIGAVVTDGPSALGLWTLRFPDEARREEGLRRLAAETAIVESAQAN